MSDGPSIRNHRITKTYFRTCSTDKSRSQAPFYLYALRLIANQAEGTFVLLRYFLGGDRPSQTAQLTLSAARIHGISVRTKTYPGWYFKVGSTRAGAAGFKASHLSYTRHTSAQYQPTVKVHGVFPSNRGYVASSPRLQFHRVAG